MVLGEGGVRLYVVINSVSLLMAVAPPLIQIEETLQIAADTVFGAMSLDSHKKDVKDYINKVSVCVLLAGVWSDADPCMDLGL